jgi:hypothetical protein
MSFNTPFYSGEPCAFHIIRGGETKYEKRSKRVKVF